MKHPRPKHPRDTVPQLRSELAKRMAQIARLQAGYAIPPSPFTPKEPNR